jgi:SAM-dependent methyltransferase
MKISTSADAGDAAGKSFWNSAWSNAKPMAYEGPVFQFSHLARKFIPDGSGKKAIELGAMPGNHLVYFHKVFGFHVTALDYVSDTSLLRNTFDKNNVTEYEIFNCDLFSVDIQSNFDLVFSSGLVEHFDDPIAILDKHHQMLRPGGLLFIGIPNTRYLHWIFMSMFCKDVLDVHRTHLMSFPVLRAYAQSTGMEVLFCDYITTFRPFYPTPLWFAWCSRAITKALRLVGLENIPNRFASPFIFFIAKKSEAGNSDR